MTMEAALAMLSAEAVPPDLRRDAEMLAAAE